MLGTQIMIESRPLSLQLGKNFVFVASLPLQQAQIRRVVSFLRPSTQTSSSIGLFLCTREIDALQSKAVGPVSPCQRLAKQITKQLKLSISTRPSKTRSLWLITRRSPHRCAIEKPENLHLITRGFFTRQLHRRLRPFATRTICLSCEARFRVPKLKRLSGWVETIPSTSLYYQEE